MAWIDQGQDCQGTLCTLTKVMNVVASIMKMRFWIYTYIDNCYIYIIKRPQEVHDYLLGPEASKLSSHTSYQAIILASLSASTIFVTTLTRKHFQSDSPRAKTPRRRTLSLNLRLE